LRDDAQPQVLRGDLGARAADERPQVLLDVRGLLARRAGLDVAAQPGALGVAHLGVEELVEVLEELLAAARARALRQGHLGPPAAARLIHLVCHRLALLPRHLVPSVAMPSARAWSL